jgi:hypothetical protein
VNPAEGLLSERKNRTSAHDMWGVSSIRWIDGEGCRTFVKGGKGKCAVGAENGVRS